MTISPDDILHFWFDEAGPKAWFSIDPNFDDEVRERFAPLLKEIQSSGGIEDHPWLKQAHSALALVLVLDQFPRNIWRDNPTAFAFDALALEATRHAIQSGFDVQVEEAHRSFFYMPFMHAEDLLTQNEGVSLCEDRLGNQDSTTRHARAHRDVIDRFGRFPHRNAILEREPSLEEISYLAEGGYAPGAKNPAKSS